jgi:hypothetical protein
MSDQYQKDECLEMLDALENGISCRITLAQKTNKYN